MTAASKPRHLLQLSRVALLVSTALAVTACVEERAFFITGNYSECSENTGATTASGVLDINGAQGYYFFPELRSELAATTDEDGEPERNMLTIDGFEVDLDVPEAIADSSLTKTFSYASGLLEPNGGTLRFSNVPIISKELVSQFPLGEGNEVVVLAKIRARAKHNGSTLKSVEFSYPIRVCRGCLVTDLGDCPSTAVEGVTTNSCGLPQDSPVVCCTQAASGNRVCLDAEQLGSLPEAPTN